MQFPDSYRLYTATCEIRTESPSRKRNPLYSLKQKTIFSPGSKSKMKSFFIIEDLFYTLVTVQYSLCVQKCINVSGILV